MHPGHLYGSPGLGSQLLASALAVGGLWRWEISFRFSVSPSLCVSSALQKAQLISRLKLEIPACGFTVHFLKTTSIPPYQD